jgi:orotidine-5'-phosphate decarboxylase
VHDPAAFCKAIVDAVTPYAVGVKPQSAFFEARGWEGVRAFEEVCDYARAADLLVIADVKRGDIGSTAQAYLDAVRPHADAATVNPYLGGDSLQPWLDAARAGFGVFVLVKTSNPGSGDVQDARLADGRRVWELVAEQVAGWGVGAVVGATYPEELAHVRTLLPNAPLLLPGVGAQGATAADCAPAFGGPALVSASRSVIFADDPAAAAEQLAREVWDVAQAA